MDVGHAVGIAPPRREPGKAVMLIHDEIKARLPAIPGNGFKNGTALAATANDLDTLKHFLARAAWKVVGVPENLMPAFHQCEQVCERDSFRSARDRVLLVAPV